MDKMERDGRNKTLYRCHFNYVLPKLIVDNELEDLQRKENPDSSEFTHYDRSSSTTSRIDRVYTDIKIASNIKINHTMVSFTDHCNAIFVDRSWYFNNSLSCKPEFSLTSKTFLFLLKTQNTTALEQVNGGKTLNLVLKNMLELFLKIHEIIRILIVKTRLQNLYEKENSNQK